MPIVAAYLLWRSRQPRLVVRFRGFHAYDVRIEFHVDLGNDGPSIARQVVVEGFLDGQRVKNLADVPVDVPPNSPLERLATIWLDRPEEADLTPGSHVPDFHGRRLSARALMANSRRRITAYYS